MKETMQIFSSVEFWKLSVPLLGAVLAWFANEWRKRIADQYRRKEESYKQLLRSLKGFYASATNADEFKAEFLDQLNLMWLYCPDHIIKKGYAFLDTIHTEKVCSDSEKEKALGDFVAAIRGDLLSRRLVRSTDLTGEDFRHLGISRYTAASEHGDSAGV